MAVQERVSFTHCYHYNVNNYSNSLIEGIGDIPAPISVVFLLSSALQPLVRRRQAELSAELTRVLLSEHRLALHCHAVRAVLLMEAGDVMHEFYSHIFSKVKCFPLSYMCCIYQVYSQLLEFMGFILALLFMVCLII